MQFCSFVFLFVLSCFSHLFYCFIINCNTISAIDNVADLRLTSVALALLLLLS